MCVHVYGGLLIRDTCCELTVSSGETDGMRTGGRVSVCDRASRLLKKSLLDRFHSCLTSSLTSSVQGSPKFCPVNSVIL